MTTLETSAGAALARTAANYQAQVTYITWPVSGWLLVCRADQRRWRLRFDLPSPGAGVVYVTPGPVAEVPFVPTNPNVPFDAKWRDELSMVTQEWWGYGISPVILPVWEVLYVGR